MTNAHHEGMLPPMAMHSINREEHKHTTHLEIYSLDATAVPEVCALQPPFFPIAKEQAGSLEHSAPLETSTHATNVDAVEDWYLKVAGKAFTRL